MNHLITGTSGFLGNYVSDHLVARHPHDQIFGLSRKPVVKKGIQPLACDLRNADEIKGAIKKAFPDRVYHFAGLSRASGPNRFDEQFEGNYLITQRLLEGLAALDKPVTLFLASSVHVYGNHSEQVTEDSARCPSSPYGFSKYLAELAVQQATERNKGLSAIVGRFYTCIGPGQEEGFVVSDFCRRLAKMQGKGDVLQTGSLKGIRAFLDVRDAAKIVGDLMGRANGPAFETFNLASAEYYTMEELLKLLLQVTGKTPIIESREETAANPFLGLKVNTAKLQKTLHPKFRPLRQTLEDTWEAIARRP